MDANEYISSSRIGQALADSINRRRPAKRPVAGFTFQVGDTATEPGIFTHIKGDPHPIDCTVFSWLPRVIGSRLTAEEKAQLAEYAKKAT